jgi:uncharacterized membrane protein
MQHAAVSDTRSPSYAQDEQTDSISPMQSILLLCHMCFFMTPFLGVAFAFLGLDVISELTRQPVKMGAHDLFVFRTGCVAIGFGLFGLGEAILLGLPALYRSNARAGSAAVSVLIVVGIATMLFAWALALRVV